MIELVEILSVGDNKAKQPHRSLPSSHGHQISIIGRGRMPAVAPYPFDVTFVSLVFVLVSTVFMHDILQAI